MKYTMYITTLYMTYSQSNTHSFITNLFPIPPIFHFSFKEEEKPPMAENFILPSLENTSSSNSTDPKSGYHPGTKTFHSLRLPVPLPNPSLPLSYPTFAFSLLPSPLPSNPALVDPTTGASISYPTFISHSHLLSYALRSRYNLSKGDVAFILSPPSLQIPVLYFALLSLGVILSPANPISTPREIAHLLTLVDPKIAFACSSSACKLPNRLKTVLLEDPEFVNSYEGRSYDCRENVRQTDGAVVQFSSGTTGRVKAALLPHRSFIAMTAGLHALRPSCERADTTLLVAPMFHSFGFFTILKGLALGETVVVMRKVGFKDILGAAERYGATLMTVAPPVVVAMGSDDEVAKYDLGRLRRVFFGGAPLSVQAVRKFMIRFPHVDLLQGYGSTETGGISRMLNTEESRHLKSAGKLTENVEAKIIDIITGNPLSIGQKGELCVRGPAIMLGYVGDEEANASTFDSDGWLKTGDLCYIDNNGYIYVVDRLKELIKYKAYQVPPAELEHLLHSLPDIVDAAVIPLPQEEVGQIPLAFVVRQKGSNISEQQIMEYVANQVAPYKKIRKVIFVNSIPKSPTGKILRRELANHAHCKAPMCRL